MTSHKKCYFLDIIILTQFGVINAFTQFSKAYIYDGIDVAANTLRRSKSSRVESCLLSCAKDAGCRSLVFVASSQECIFGSLNFPGTYQRMTTTQIESYQKALHNCDAGWTEFQGSCYFMTGRTLSLVDADTACKSHGAHLVFVESEEENQFIATLTQAARSGGDKFYLGITDCDGPKFSYKLYGTTQTAPYINFLSGEGTDTPSNSCCVLLIVGSQWNDNYCIFQMRAVCEKEMYN